VDVLQTISTILCFVGILRLTKYLKPSLSGFKPMSKLITFKLLVALDVLQNLIFSALSNSGVVKATRTLNLPDFLIGTPGLIVCCECFIFSILLLFPYSAKPYSAQKCDSEQQNDPPMGLVSAIFDVLNISDIISGVFYCFDAQKGGRSEGTTRLTSEGYLK